MARLDDTRRFHAREHRAVPLVWRADRLVLHPERQARTARPRWPLAFRDVPESRRLASSDSSARYVLGLVRDALILLVAAWVLIVWTATA